MIAVSNVSARIPSRIEHVAQVGHADEGLAPRADAAVAAPLGSSHAPPSSRQIASAWSQPLVDAAARRLEAEHEQRVRRRRRHPSAAASSSSIRRQFDGSSPDWAIARTASRAGEERARSARPRDARCSGRGCTRTHARVITPSVPSEPSSMRSGLGPAPEPGSRRDSQSRRRDRAHALDEIVDVRQARREVPAGARRDPAAERRELERLREEAHRHAVRAEQLLDARARRAGTDQRGARDRRRARAARRARRGRAQTAPSKRAGSRASTPPTTLVPPP